MLRFREVGNRQGEVIRDSVPLAGSGLQMHGLDFIAVDVNASFPCRGR
jgi:hypothetical protein